VVRVPDYRSRVPGFYSRLYQAICKTVGLERCPPSYERIIEEPLGRNGSDCCIVNRD
jgi:hypothetical protein